MCRSLISFNQIRASLMNLSEKQGRIARAVFFIFVFALFFTASQSAMASSRIALVIGNAKYEKVGVLDNTINDAKLIESKLSAMGFETQLLLDATESKLKRAVREFASASEQSDIGLVFYAGHGVQVSGENFLLPIDMEPPRRESDVPLLAINVDDVLRSINSRVKILVLDACRDNPVISRSLKGSRGGVTRGLAPPQQNNTSQEGGVFIAYATESGDVASDGKGSNSPFSLALAEHISKPISIDDMFSLVTRDVRRLTNNSQRPFKYASMDSVVCLTGECSTSISPGADNRPQSNKENTNAQVHNAPEDVSGLISGSDPHEIYQFIVLNPGHPERTALIDRLRALSAPRISSRLLMDSLASNNQLWFYQPNSFKRLNTNVVSLTLVTQEIKKILIFDSLTDKVAQSAFDCVNRRAATFLMGEISSEGKITKVDFEINPDIAPLAPVPEGSIFDHAWNIACTPHGLLPILPMQAATLQGWELVQTDETASHYINRNVTFGDAKNGVSYYRKFNVKPKVMEPSSLLYTQEIYRYRFDCVEKKVAIDGEYIDPQGKLIAKFAGYGPNQWTDIVPGGPAGITYPIACKRPL